MDRLLKWLEENTGRKLDARPRRYLEEKGIISPDKDQQNRVIPNRPPKPPDTYIPTVPDAPAIKQKILVELLRKQGQLS